jgi:hypothetical protein
MLFLNSDLFSHPNRQFTNSTGAYELDPTLVNDFAHTWREMHVKTNVFCSGSIILPDKAGRQINVGGWAEGKYCADRRFIYIGADSFLRQLVWHPSLHPRRLPGCQRHQ